MGGAADRLHGGDLAVVTQPDHRPRPPSAVEQHLQLGGRPVPRRLRGCLPRRRHDPGHEHPRGQKPGRGGLAHLRPADRVRAFRRPGPGDPGPVRARLRPAGHLAGGPLLPDVVQRLPRTDHRRRVHLRFRDVPPARQRVPAVQPERCPLPASDRRELRDAQPPQRQRAYRLRGHLPLAEPGPDPLGPASPRDGTHPVDLAVDEGRRGPHPDRDARGLAPDLPRRSDLLQRLRLLDGRGPARP